MAGENVKEAISQVKRRVGLETPTAADDDGNVGIVRGALRAFGEGDMDGFLDALKEDIAWEGPQGKKFPGSGEYEGRDQVKEKFVGAVQRTYSTFGFRPESYLDADDEDSVVVIGRFVGEGLEGAQVDVAGAQIWQLEGNRVSRVVILTDSEPFPQVLSEEDSEKREKENQEEAEEAERKQKETEGKSDSDSSEDEDEAKSEGDEKSGSDADGERKGQAEAKSDEDEKGQAEAKSGEDEKGRAEAKSDTEGSSEGREKSDDEKGQDEAESSSSSSERGEKQEATSS